MTDPCRLEPAVNGDPANLGDATWPEDRDTELTHVNMYVVYEDITLETLTALEDREQRTSLVYRHGCGDNEPQEIEPPDI